jgi:hypothetical protein
MDTKQAISMEFPEEQSIVRVTEEHRQALAVPDRARALVVVGQESLDIANAFLKDIKRLASKISESFDPQITQAHNLHRSLLTEKKKFTDPLEQAERIIKPKIADYLAEEDRKHLEASRAKARAEREAERIADEATDKAYELDRKGQESKADAVIDKAYGKVGEILASAPVVPEPPRKEGLSIREDWKAEIVNAALVPREYLIPDEVKIGRVVRAMKGQIEIPGIRIFSVKIVSSRTS